MAAPAPVLCAGGAGVLLGAFQVWGVSVAEGWCRRVRGRRRAASWADDRTQDTQEFTHAPDESKVARNLGTLTFLRYRENVAIPTM